MTHPQLNLQADEDALFDYIDGENDALALEQPASNNYYYLMGWHDTKDKLAKGELTIELAREPENNTDDNNWDSSMF